MERPPLDPFNIFFDTTDFQDLPFPMFVPNFIAVVFMVHEKLNFRADGQNRKQQGFVKKSFFYKTLKMGLKWKNLRNDVKLLEIDIHEQDSLIE